MRNSLWLLPFWWEGFNDLAHHLLLPRVCIDWKLESGAKLELELKPSEMRCVCVCPNQEPNC